MRRRWVSFSNKRKEALPLFLLLIFVEHPRLFYLTFNAFFPMVNPPKASSYHFFIVPQQEARSSSWWKCAGRDRGDRP